MASGARLLATGFGPFPGAPENPTATLMRGLAEEVPATFGASAFRAIVLKTEYRRSWAALRRLFSTFAPDIVVHFGLNSGIDAIHLECVGRNVVDPAKPDAAGYAPGSHILSPHGPETLASTFPVEAILASLEQAGFSAAASENAGSYVCNATLYRSLQGAPTGRRVGFVHVPPTEALAPADLLRSAKIILTSALAER